MKKHIYLVNVHNYEENTYYNYAFRTAKAMLKHANKLIDLRVADLKIDEKQKEDGVEIDRRNGSLFVDEEGRIECRKMELDTGEGILL